MRSKKIAVDAGTKNITPAVETAEEVVKQGDENTYSVYLGYDGVTQEVKYVGITGRLPEIRFEEHLSSGTQRASLTYKVMRDMNNLSRIEARVMEQTLINKYGLENLVNIRNSISPKYWSKYGIKP